MSASADDLARRLVEIPHWRWMSGMRAMAGPNRRAVVVHVDEDGHALLSSMYRGCEWAEWSHDVTGPNWRPDLSDPATEGCLLWLAREAHGDKYLRATFRARHGEVPGWVVLHGARGFLHPAHGPVTTYPTEAEALAHAILAAPEVRDA